MKMVRTDSTAMTLDRFLVTGNMSNNSRGYGHGPDKQTVVSMNIVSVKKLIHDYEGDVDPKLQ